MCNRLAIVYMHCIVNELFVTPCIVAREYDLKTIHCSVLIWDFCDCISTCTCIHSSAYRNDNKSYMYHRLLLPLSIDTRLHTYNGTHVHDSSV